MSCAFLTKNIFCLLYLEKDSRPAVKYWYSFTCVAVTVNTERKLFHFNLLPELITNYWNWEAALIYISGIKGQEKFEIWLEVVIEVPDAVAYKPKPPLGLLKCFNLMCYWCLHSGST